jgi:hypothetical protein
MIVVNMTGGDVQNTVETLALAMPGAMIQW